RVAFGQQPAARADGQASPEAGGTALKEGGTLAGRAEADLLVDHQLGRGGRVVDLDDVEILGADPRLVVGPGGGPFDGAGFAGGTVPPRDDDRGPHPHPGAAVGPGDVGGAEDGGGGAVADGGAHHQRQGGDNGPAGQDLFPRHLVAVLGQRVERAVQVVLHRD